MIVGLYFSFSLGLHKGKKTKFADKAFKGSSAKCTSNEEGVTKFSKDVNFLYLKLTIYSSFGPSNSPKFIANVKGGNSSLSIWYISIYLKS